MGDEHKTSLQTTTRHAPMGWGSDAIVEQLARLDLKYLALVPGSSYRGVHDSIVNYLGNGNPRMLVCLHEEHAVAVAHGYAKVAERPMAAGLHANVGLMHASMAIYNAFCDRVPMVILGATGPLDATQRRPWIDWIHTATDQAALVRSFVKWDDQPHSAGAAVASLLQAAAVTVAKPCAPVYVCLDVRLQEDGIDPAAIHFPPTHRYLNTATPPGASAESVEKAFHLLTQSRRPLLLPGRVNRSAESWDHRVQLVAHWDMRVLTDVKQGAAFPHPHRQHAAPPAVFPSPTFLDVMRQADLIISLDWVDLAGTLHAAGSNDTLAKIIHVSLDSALHNGWSKDHFGVAPVDVPVSADPDKFVAELLKFSRSHHPHPVTSHWPSTSIAAANGPLHPPSSSSSDQTIHMPHLARALYAAVPAESISLIRIPLSWAGSDLRTPHPLSFLGMDGGAGIGSGPGQAVGSALALRDLNADLLPVAVLGDGDFLMASSALWTGTSQIPGSPNGSLPLLIVVANNRSYYNDEVHQERVAKHRSRPVENKYIGMRLTHESDGKPTPDCATIARGLGCGTVCDGIVERRDQLEEVLVKAVKMARGEGRVVVVDVLVRPEGYSGALEKGK